jgi:ketosteroid isomerase-like protein
MPSKQRVDALIAMVVAGQHAEAIEAFYHEDATMQENLNPPRVGRLALVEHERRALSRVKEVRSFNFGPALIDGDTVMINWVFEFDYLDGRQMKMTEIARQTWQGDRITEERFYYDPAQMKAQ